MSLLEWGWGKLGKKVSSTMRELDKVDGGTLEKTVRQHIRKDEGKCEGLREVEWGKEKE